MVVEAAKLCAYGVQYYPEYVGGYILLADAYETLGQLHDAQLIREELHARFPSLPALKSYVQHVEYVEQPTESDEEVESASVIVVEPESDPIIAAVDFETEPIINVDVEPVSTHQSHPNVLRIIEMVPVTNDTRIIKSSSVRLIPGLEYTSLRFEGTRSRGRRQIISLMEPPPFRTFHQMRRSTRPHEGTEVRKKTVTLEELAARLNDARLPRTPAVETEHSTLDLSTSPIPIMVTETIARIYMQQGSYDLAIEAFTTLQKQKPEKYEEFALLIRDCERKRS